MKNLSLKELRTIAKSRNIDGYKSMPKNKLLRIIKNNNKKNRNSFYEVTRNSLFKSKILYDATRTSISKSKREKCLYEPTRKVLFK